MTSTHVALLRMELPCEQMYQSPNALERYLLRTGILHPNSYIKGS